MSSAARELLAVLLAPAIGVEGNWLELVGIRGGSPGVPKSEPRAVAIDLADPACLDLAIDVATTIANEGENVYFGPVARTKPVGPGHPRSSDDDVKELFVLWADADPPKGDDGLPIDPTWKAKWREAFGDGPLKPSARVDSGHGYHLYWFLKDSTGPEAARALMERICSHVPDGDPTVKNPSRILRLPGYYHVKDPKNPLPTKLDWCEPTIRYSIAEIDKAFPQKKKERSKPERATEGRVQTSARKARSLSEKSLDRILQVWGPGRRHMEALPIFGAMRKSGWSEDEANVALEQLIARGGGDWKDLGDVIRTTWTKDIEDVVGWDGLRDLGFLDDELPEIQTPRPRRDTADGLRTDQGNARAFALTHGESFRHANDIGRWFFWDGKRWAEKVAPVEVENAAKRTTLDLLHQAYEMPEDDGDKRGAIRWALKSQSHGMRQAMLKTACTEPELGIYQEQLDKDPFLLTVANGTLNLETGELRPHRREDLITSMSSIPYDKNAYCPRWEQFLLEIFDGDMELALYIQRAIGYTLTGSTREQCLFLMHGTGENGKSKFVKTINALLGDFARTAAFKTFLAKENDNSVPNDLACLRGARLVSAIEADEGVRFNEALLKTVTGEDAIAARFLYGEWFRFQPTFKLWLAANHKPVIKGTDHAIWRRIKFIPFKVNFKDDPRKDPKLEEKLFAELPGVLAWAVEGTRMWLKSGLGGAAAVDAATNEYRGESDLVGRFLDSDTLVRGAGFEIKATELYSIYSRWCEEGGERPISGTKFGRTMNDRGINKEERKRGNYYLGYAAASSGDVGRDRRYAGDDFS